MTLHLAAASALGKDGTAVAEGGKAGRGRGRRKGEEEKRKKTREGDMDSWIEGKGREKGRKRRV